VVKYKKTDKKEKGGYLDLVTTKAKSIPDPTKYSQLAKWVDTRSKRGKFLKENRITLF
jgi:hypothetical protein